MSRVIEIIDSEDDDNGPTKSLSNTNIIEAANDSQLSHSRRRPRKSLLQSLPDPEVQFETIAVDDDNDINLKAKEGNVTLLRPLQQRTTKTTPKILAPKPPSNADAIVSAFEEYMTRLDAKECLATIAHERVRVNYLLSLFGMPEINFSLYTQPEILKFQLEERLKQQKMMQNWSGNRVQVEGRGRSLLQSNIEQENSFC